MGTTTAMDEWDDNLFSFIQKLVVLATSNKRSASPVSADERYHYEQVSSSSTMYIQLS